MWLKICRCHSKWGLDDSVSFPALGGTEFCKFVLFLIEFFNGDIKKKKKNCIILVAKQNSPEIMDELNLGLVTYEKVRYSPAHTLSI